MKIPCPKCREKGGDTAGDNLQVYDNGAYCHACNHSMSLKDLKEYQQSGVSQPSFKRVRDQDDAAAELQAIRSYPIREAPHKMLGKPVMQLYGVRQSVDGDGTPDAVYYPYYDKGEVIDCKKRILPKRFYAITGRINRAGLFGQQLAPAPDRRNLLIITEGEDDAMAAKEMLWMMGKDYLVNSVQNGADENGKLDNTLLRQIEYLTSFKKVALCFDQDKPGVNTAKALAEILAPHTEVRIMSLPDGCKDAYELRAANGAADFLDRLNNAEHYVPEDIIEGSTITLAELMEPIHAGWSLPYPKLNFKLQGLRGAEITTITAATGIGKTTLCREIGYHMVEHHELSVANVFLEEQWKKTAQGYIAIDNNIPLPLLRSKPGVLPTEAWEASRLKLIASGKIHFFKHFGSVQSMRLIQKLRYFALALKVKLIILDHVTMVLSGEASRDERKDVDILMTRLAELSVETGVGVIAVVHLKRADDRKEGFNEGGEVRITDLRGSSQIEALSSNVIALERDQQSETRSNISMIRLLKGREWGMTGLCDRLIYNPNTGRLTAGQSSL